MFSIIIPNYNNEEYLDRLFDSINRQTFQDYEIIFVDDCSTDNSILIAKTWKDKYLKDKIQIKILNEKRWNGGARNVGLQYRNMEKHPYTLFIDSDDIFSSNESLSFIATIIKNNKNPDLIRLPYNWCGDENRFVNLTDQTTPQLLVSACDVACWTKCVKSELVVKFPECTLMEDVVQHLAQIDNIETMAVVTKPIIDWNRKNSHSCSTEAGKNLKWDSSFYRYIADLMDLELKKDFVREERDKRLAQALYGLKKH